MSNRKLLVSGGSGHLGRAVLDHLLSNTQGESVIAGTREPSRLKELAARGVEVRELDFDRTETMAAALRGVDRFLIISTDNADRPGYRAQQHGRAVAEAVRAGGASRPHTCPPGSSSFSSIPSKESARGGWRSSAMTWRRSPAGRRRASPSSSRGIDVSCSGNRSYTSEYPMFASQGAFPFPSLEFHRFSRDRSTFRATVRQDRA